MQTQLLKEINSVLKGFPQYWNGETLKRSEVITAIENKEPLIIKALVSNEKLKQQYSTDIDGILLFDFAKLINLIQYKEYWKDSFTKYKNKIGLTSNGNYLSDSGDIVLDFPFKDCMLEGGMSKSEIGKNEVFYNEIIAADEIDRLKQPKVLVNAKRYSTNGVDDCISKIAPDDNLIIKGNNLLVLHSLKECYKGKIKLLYIDPPFNTGSDEFLYNDKFKHSTWLTFMKNRLEVSKDLLAPDGVIFVHIGNEEASYLQVLMDEIFERNNCLNHITMTTNAPSGFKATSDKIFSTANHIFLYAKDSQRVNLTKIYVPKEYDKSYKYYLINPTEHHSNWKYTTIQNILAQEKGMSEKEFKASISESDLKKLISNFADKNKERVFRTAAIGGGAAKKRAETIAKSKTLEGIVIQHPEEDVEDFYILNGEQILFWSKVYNEIDGKLMPSMSLTDVWTDIPFTGIANEGGVKFKNAKKPELLLKRILEISTHPNDIVLDFHLGSGTTAATAHKMKRRYIGVEQIENQIEITLTRLKNVINNENHGISKLVNWQGGGSFVYCELAKLNQNYVDSILRAESTEQLNSTLDVMQHEAYLNYQIELENLLKSTYEVDGVEHEVEFSQLSLAEQKELLIALLDKNQLYVNLSEIDDVKMKISDTDKKFTQSFYQLEI